MTTSVLFALSGGIDKVWLKEKDEVIIVPEGLRERDFSNVPAKEKKKQGPVFGTNVGKSKDKLGVEGFHGGHVGGLKQ